MLKPSVFLFIAEPGGYLQWVERDWLSKFPRTATSSDDANTQLTAFMHKRLGNVRSVYSTVLSP